MAKNNNRIKVGLKCSECGDINYSTYKNTKAKEGKAEKLELKKYCPRLRKHTLHKEVKLKG